MGMEGGSPEVDSSTRRPAMKPESKPHQNGSCRVAGPSESENKMEGDLSKIRSKFSNQNETRTQKSNNTNPAGTSSGETVRDATCGIYYGIKSYLHHFYAPPDKEVLKSGEYVQGDDFRFLSEPRRKACWVRAGLWVGVNLALLGGVVTLVGYLTPPRQAVVAQFQEFTVLDRWAVNFNYHLLMCQLAGLLTLGFGVVVVICCLLVANCHPSPPPPTYLVMGTFLPSPTPNTTTDTPPSWGIHCIPLSGTVKSVQPQFIRPHY